LPVGNPAEAIKEISVVCHTGRSCLVMMLQPPRGSERAALGWTESPKAQFTEEEQVKLTLTVVVINGWNRIAVDFVDPAAVKSAAKAAAA